MNLKIKDSTAMEWRGKFNVIYVTFGHFYGNIRSEEDCINACRTILHAAFRNFRYITSFLPEGDVIAFNKWCNEDSYLLKTKPEVGNGLKFLSRMCCRVRFK